MFESLLTSLSNNMMLSQAVLLPAELSVNQLLQHDGAALKTIAADSGCLVCIEVNDFTPLYVRLLDSGVSFSFDNAATADVIMRGSLTDFIALAKADNKANQLINSGIDMDGDTELSIRLTKVVQNLDIDWEALIQPLTGSMMAHHIGQRVRNLMKWHKSTGDSYQMAAKDYLEDEAQLVTPEPLLAEFADQVDELRLASDRLQARLDVLAAKRAIKSQQTRQQDGQCDSPADPS